MDALCFLGVVELHGTRSEVGIVVEASVRHGRIACLKLINFFGGDMKARRNDFLLRIIEKCFYWSKFTNPLFIGRNFLDPRPVFLIGATLVIAYL